MDDNNAMVEKSNHELKQQLGISDDIIISKFSNDFSLKLLSPLIRLKKGLNLSLPELVSRSRDRENLLTQKESFLCQALPALILEQMQSAVNLTLCP